MLLIRTSCVINSSTEAMLSELVLQYGNPTSQGQTGVCVCARMIMGGRRGHMLRKPNRYRPLHCAWQREEERRERRERERGGRER